ncbi:hypothetical protein [Allohahella marinimesophila]|uniref:GGDEF domain-containing protein n=1 Tax=Allohahella marinimesophila TaxID=1054972 RepID=A0ABP7P2J1_9GAMM
MPRGRVDDVVHTLLQRADAAMYYAKQSGKRQVRVWPIPGDDE